MLIGTWSAALDADGRIALPPAFRRAAADGLIVTRSCERCLQVFPAVTWLPLAQRVSALPITLAAARTLRRSLFGAAVQLYPDDAGLLCLPDSLRAGAELAHHALWVGMYSYSELWAAERWAQAWSVSEVRRGFPPQRRRDAEVFLG
jgi:MraZ protein